MEPPEKLLEACEGLFQNVRDRPWRKLSTMARGATSYQCKCDYNTNIFTLGVEQYRVGQCKTCGHFSYYVEHKI